MDEMDFFIQQASIAQILYSHEEWNSHGCVAEGRTCLLKLCSVLAHVLVRVFFFQISFTDAVLEGWDVPSGAARRPHGERTSILVTASPMASYELRTGSR